MKEVPYNPGAPAIQLYFSYYKDDNEKFLSVYRRIKILTEAGKKYADAEIEIDPGESLKQLMARTLHPDGTIVEFQGKPFEKTLSKKRGVKYVAKTFAFPDVTSGSIIEYMYRANCLPSKSGCASIPIRESCKCPLNGALLRPGRGSPMHT